MSSDNLFFARRLGFGLRPGEDLPAAPRDWAVSQLGKIPPLDFMQPDGSTASPPIPTFVPPIVNFEEALHGFERSWVQEHHLDAIANTMSVDEYNRRAHSERMVPLVFGPVWADCLARTMTLVNGTSDVFERFWMFWCNHFTVSTVQNDDIPLFWGAHIRAIRNRMTGRFADMLYDAVANPAMFHYLDNDTSAGPHSNFAHDPKERHYLNENLGRELLELHTVGPEAGYTQADVIQTALVLTGWRFQAGKANEQSRQEPYRVYFNPDQHEPGPRTIMGKVYKPVKDGANQLHDLTDDLAQHPATVQHIAFKLAREFLADDPPPESVEKIAGVFTESKGDLVAVHSAVIDEVIAHGREYSKMTTPENWLVQSFRLTGAPIPVGDPDLTVGLESAILLCRELGQAPCESPQPNGFPALKADWLSKEMLSRRVRQAYRMGQQSRGVTTEALGEYCERLAGADSPLVPVVKRAESLPLAVAVLLASPQFLKV